MFLDIQNRRTVDKESGFEGLMAGIGLLFADVESWFVEAKVVKGLR